MGTKRNNTFFLMRVQQKSQTFSSLGATLLSLRYMKATTVRDSFEKNKCSQWFSDTIHYTDLCEDNDNSISNQWLNSSTTLSHVVLVGPPGTCGQSVGAAWCIATSSCPLTSGSGAGVFVTLYLCYLHSSARRPGHWCGGRPPWRPAGVSRARWSLGSPGPAPGPRPQWLGCSPGPRWWCLSPEETEGETFRKA